ncbi:DUF6484 domain-containing protein [Piscinibacter terrae]|uniref:DUF6484 domain-containing protein n=1 Tax=Piscinibacter terrae TaxID=2496871 RepID=A0A3N7HSX1_9BURK|nr:DUF6484 domain-containing protein [Albitalea terrae]RQP25398.1 hypothetical protein DZC73_11290 [Albitalea terrae]
MSGRDPIEPLVACAPAGVVVGELVALADEGRTPLVMDTQRPEAGVVRARSVVELRGVHIGRSVVLMFENGDPSRPIVMGLLQGDEGWPAEHRPQDYELEADGRSLVVTARERLVLRCGKACITLTRGGKVLIEGTYLLSRSTGVSRIKGGSVQLN